MDQRLIRQRSAPHVAPFDVWHSTAPVSDLIARNIACATPVTQIRAKGDGFGDRCGIRPYRQRYLAKFVLLIPCACEFLTALRGFTAKQPQTNPPLLRKNNPGHGPAYYARKKTPQKQRSAQKVKGGQIHRILHGPMRFGHQPSETLKTRRKTKRIAAAHNENTPNSIPQRLETHAILR